MPFNWICWIPACCCERWSCRVHGCDPVHLSLVVTCILLYGISEESAGVCPQAVADAVDIGSCQQLRQLPHHPFCCHANINCVCCSYVVVEQMICSFLPVNGHHSKTRCWVIAQDQVCHMIHPVINTAHQSFFWPLTYISV